MNAFLHSLIIHNFFNNSTSFRSSAIFDLDKANYFIPWTLTEISLRDPYGAESAPETSGSFQDDP